MKDDVHIHYTHLSTVDMFNWAPFVQVVFSYLG